MGKEYTIKCKVLPSQDLQKMFARLPSPIHRTPLAEIYNFKVEKDGFYFIDHLVDTTTASVAFRVFTETALLSNETVEISEL